MTKLSLLPIFIPWFLPHVAQAICTPPGAVFSIPTLTTDNPGIVALNRNLTAMIDFLLTNPKHADLLLNETSFSIGITSIDGTLFESHHTAKYQGDYVGCSAQNVTGDTVYRIASITKVFTVLGVLLQSGVCLDDPITKYVPELTEGSNSGGIRWEEITLRALGSQLSGIPREYGMDALGSIDYNLAVQSGLPAVNPDIPPCGKNSTDAVCSRAQFFNGFKQRPPMFYPSDQASYSNAAFAILGYALENITGKSYEQLLQEEIFTPLDFTHTSIQKPDDSQGIIPYGPNDWRWDLGSGNADGGLYSSTNDLLKFVRGILTNQLLPQSKTNAWLKPASYSGSLTTTYGMPWEICRSNELTPDGRVVTVYTKNGGLGGYTSLIVLVPDYNIAATFLVAGNSAAMGELSNGFATFVIPPIDAIARAETKTLYAGSYSDSSTNSNLTLTVDEDGPGIRVVEWFNRGVDFLSVLGDYYQLGSVENFEVRMYPTGLNAGGKYPWRFDINLVPALAKNATQSTPWGDLCFGDADTMTWGGQPLNELVFDIEGGKVTGVSLTG
ncbi:hypothetical protein RUND412_011610, partial [Rhizina undulata]